ncbi:5'-methylthioadenosine/S-adenosylhomocysteine nucleosidase [Sphingomicrobium sp. XHP0235]|uniref:5'-methylthioadenosine/S-adenosylhomocysteine nucleosidase family protein n=1 Tax=Sphingomicrobium aquimarinum TaxID=3133971 RepID=UPI0031FF14A6
MLRIGIITGLLEEAERFRPGSGRSRHDLPFYCRQGDDGWLLACAGIGKVNGTIAAMHLVAEGCRLLVSMGVAGRIGQGSENCYRLDRAYQHDYGRFDADRFVTYRAGSLPFGDALPQSFNAVPDVGLDLPSATILTGDAFIADEGKASAIAEQFGAELVDMETGAIAQVADMHRIGWAGVRAISDKADQTGVGAFKDNLQIAAMEAARHVDRLVDLVHRQQH